MKKVLSGILCFATLIALNTSVFASVRSFDSSFKRQETIGIYYSGDCETEDIWRYMQDSGEDERIAAEAEENEHIVGFILTSESVSEMEPVEIELNSERDWAGGRPPSFGKNYRVYLFEDGNFTDIPVINSSNTMVEFTAEKEGIYVIYFDPAVYDYYFYTEVPEIDDDGNEIEVDPYYYKTDQLKSAEVEFPEIPQKEGYVFTGWQAWQGSGMHYVGPQPITARDYYDYYATWCPEDEYEPLEITISSENTIRKGEEDGQVIYLTASDGVFDEYVGYDWYEYYEAETDEEIKAEILAEWETRWKIVGSDEVVVKTAERVDDKTVKLTLMGNSEDKTRSTDIKVAFNGGMLEGDIIRLDEEGVRQAMYTSNNEIAFKKKSSTRRTSSASEPTKYTVKFETNGGSEIENRSIVSGEKIGDITAPEKEGYEFDGWYTDIGLKLAYDENMAVTNSMTLYAKWTEDNSQNQIILTPGNKNVLVFGEERENDVAPLIKNNRVVLPSRFIAEALGAGVIWNESEPNKVTIRKDDIEIIIYIGSETAYVNGEEYVLDSPAFIQNNRTYTPLRFICEQLGADVLWIEETNRVTITYVK